MPKSEIEGRPCTICELQSLGDSRLDPGLCVGLLTAGTSKSSPYTFDRLYANACKRHRGDLTYWNRKITESKAAVAVHVDHIYKRRQPNSGRPTHAQIAYATALLDETGDAHPDLASMTVDTVSDLITKLKARIECPK